jgi:hypothetical protein
VYENVHIAEAIPDPRASPYGHDADIIARRLLEREAEDRGYRRGVRVSTDMIRRYIDTPGAPSPDGHAGAAASTTGALLRSSELMVRRHLANTPSGGAEDEDLARALALSMEEAVARERDGGAAARVPAPMPAASPPAVALPSPPPAADARYAASIIDGWSPAPAPAPAPALEPALGATSVSALPPAEKPRSTGQ